MTKSHRLRPLMKLAKNNEQQAARVLSECRHRLQEQESRLEDLRGYRREYAARLSAVGAAGADAATLQRFKAFLVKLDEAIVLQGKQTERVSRECEEMSRLWSHARVRHKSLNKAVDHYRLAELRRRERHEQQVTDEFVQTVMASLEEET